MDVYEAIEKRRTIRAFTKGVSEELVRKIILAGTRALSAGNNQPWEFIIIDDRKIIDQIAEQKYQANRKPELDVDPAAQKQRDAYQNCSVVALCSKKVSRGSEGAWMCFQNMALAATAEGLGVVPSTFGGERREAVEKLIGLPEDYELITVMLCGVPGEEPRHKDVRPDFSWLHRNRFGSTS
ncbi:nitroreductase family protein [Chloroflexota bacterium]